MSELNETTETKTTTRKRAPRKDPAPKVEGPAYLSELLKEIEEVDPTGLRELSNESRRQYALRAQNWSKAAPSLPGSLMARANQALAQRDPDKLRAALLRVAAVALAKVEEIDGASK
ncbi:hypothetical protein SEA_GODPOWER_41 [Streptomyces phage Godpower]|uniref:Uncharacterized protein n=2 Tax=Likavirus lika TaxID=1982890 RepID=R4TP90_9CAUD|nr:hypothetical protein M051_gp40 [Streptomyces phage Lika]AGM12063.1 hypothetical protein LIKA_40 [Streptomyces phage Lika]AOQ27016.1 hypothetical protein SEA_GODPOWER_41 [Streptomyces phage Godpower]